MSSDRFKELKEVDEESKAGLEEEEPDESDGSTGSDGSNDGTGTISNTGTTGTSSSTGTNSSKSSTGTSSEGSSGGNVKDRNPRMSMFPPEEHKEGFDDALRKVKAICSLADEPEPNKLSEFSGALLKHGYDDLEGICGELELEGAYKEYGDVVEG